jgi:geranylgeranyl diphosphate synthase type II
LDLSIYLQKKKELIDEALDIYLPSPNGYASTIHKAMRYSLLGGGKRLRPILTIASCELVDGDSDSVLPFACAIELIHTYSLIHDDLPAMDNDDYRRGNLTNHRVFGEAAAILAGDALLTEAFRLMTDSKTIFKLNTPVVLDVINDIAYAAGVCGMIGGQIVDLESEGKEVFLPDIEYIHTHKTGHIIRASVMTGVKLGGGTEEEIELLSEYGKAIGLAFQIIDDILNVEGDKAELGKSVGSDAKKGKATYPGVLGIDDSRRSANLLIDKAIGFLEKFDDKAEPLRMIARYIEARKK